MILDFLVLQADKLGMDATHQSVGPEFAGVAGSTYPAYFGWKALLKPAAAGGNYTRFAGLLSMLITESSSCARETLDRAHK